MQFWMRREEGDAGAGVLVSGTGRSRFEGQIAGLGAARCKSDHVALAAECCGKRVPAAAFQNDRRMVQCRHLSDVTLMLCVRALRPKQMPAQPLMPVDKGVDAVGVNAERNDKRLLALALQSVGLTGAQKANAAFGQGFGTVR